MTQQEFEDNIGTWSELIQFCNDYGCSYCDDVYSDGGKDENINNNLIDMAYDASDWTSLLATLRDIPTGYDYYYKDDYGDWYGLCDDDFEDYKSDVLEWAINEDIFDDYDEECGEKPSYVDEEEFTPPEETISIADLMTACNNGLWKSATT